MCWLNFIKKHSNSLLGFYRFDIVNKCVVIRSPIEKLQANARMVWRDTKIKWIKYSIVCFCVENIPIWWMPILMKSDQVNAIFSSCLKIRAHFYLSLLIHFSFFVCEKRRRRKKPSLCVSFSNDNTFWMRYLLHFGHLKWKRTTVYGCGCDGIRNASGWKMRTAFFSLFQLTLVTHSLCDFFPCISQFHSLYVSYWSFFIFFFLFVRLFSQFISSYSMEKSELYAICRLVRLLLFIIRCVLLLLLLFVFKFS